MKTFSDEIKGKGPDARPSRVSPVDSDRVGDRPRGGDRMWLRRATVEHRRRRRRLRILAAFLASASAAGIGWGTLRSELFDTDSVIVRPEKSGSPRTTSDQVAAATKARGTALIDLDLQAMARRVEDLPWVDRASVRRSWPGTVEVVFTERIPVASVEVRGSISRLLVDNTGRILGTATPSDDKLPRLLRLEGKFEVGSILDSRSQDLLAAAAAIPDPMGASVVGVGLVEGPGGGVVLRLRPQGLVLLGDVSDLAQKMVAAAAVFAQVDLTDLNTIDVRVAVSPVVSRDNTVEQCLAADRALCGDERALTQRSPITKVSTEITG